MSNSLHDVMAAAATLPAEDRAELARFLFQSLDGGEDVDARDEWLALAQRRMADVKAGKVVGIPADEVLRNLRGPRR